MPELVLKGCRSRPLAGYLKALGIFSVLSRQKDALALGQWQDAGFVLNSCLDQAALEDFFLTEYAPTPLVTPWNKGGGFYREDNAKTTPLDRIRACKEERFALYGQVIESIFAWPEFSDTSDSGAARLTRLREWCEKNKPDIQMRCRNTLPESCVDWLDAAFILRDGENAAYPPLLGTGGNDGNLEFALTFMNCLVELFIEEKSAPHAAQRLKAALWGYAVPDTGKVALGQFDPGNAGGVNQGMGFKHEHVPANPWDYVLALEGALLFAGSLSRRNAADPAQASAPFTVRSIAAGYASCALADGARGEMWLPLWRSPLSLRELRALLREGRATLKRRQARTGLDFALAVSSLGVDRGVAAFERYAFLQRRGKAFSALPVGRVPVRHHPEVMLLDEAALCMEKAKGIKNPPDSLKRGLRQLEQALFACSPHPTPQNFQRVCLALAHLDSLPVIGKCRKPFWGLSPEWIRRCDDERVEVRLAAALASLGDARQSSCSHPQRLGPVRCQIQNVDVRNPGIWSGKDGVLWHGADVNARLGNVLIRRMLEAARLNVPENAFVGHLHLPPEDAVALALGQVDTALLEGLFRAFTLIDYAGQARSLPQWEEPVTRRGIPQAWRVLKLTHMPPCAVRCQLGGDPLRPEPRVARLLWAGRMVEACRLAERRLRISGFAVRPVKDVGEAMLGMTPRALLASLLIPVFSPPKVAGNLFRTQEAS